MALLLTGKGLPRGIDAYEDVDDVAYLIAMDPADVEALVEEALSEIEAQTRAKVLIIEDEPIIAMDIETIVRDLGHEVTGVAVTRASAWSRLSGAPLLGSLPRLFRNWSQVLRRSSG